MIFGKTELFYLLAWWTNKIGVRFHPKRGLDVYSRYYDLKVHLLLRHRVCCFTELVVFILHGDERSSPPSVRIVARLTLKKYSMVKEHV